MHASQEPQNTRLRSCAYVSSKSRIQTRGCDRCVSHLPFLIGSEVAGAAHRPRGRSSNARKFAVVINVTVNDISVVIFVVDLGAPVALATG
jgi:hypothetical protein